MNSDNNINNNGLNQDNFNMQSNGINNVPLQNNQANQDSELNNNFQNTNFDQGQMNNTMYSNVNQQNGSNNSIKPPKKNNLGLIIAIAGAVVVAGAGIAIGGKLLANKNDDLNIDNNITDNDNNNSVENDDKILTALEYFDTNKFDKSKFNGILYDRNNMSYNVSDLLFNDNNINIIANEVMFYSFSNDFINEKSDFSSSGSVNSDKYIYKILDLLGHPSTYFESYTEGNNGYTGSFYLLYNYGDYIIVFMGSDFRNWNDYNYKYPYLHACYITKNENNFITTNDMINKGYTSYGENI